MDNPIVSFTIFFLLKVKKENKQLKEQLKVAYGDVYKKL
ncbi:hypothetical protein FH5_03537 [Priestia endophytica]|nr:hypothetical protein FH5_03537 [Priestia endophytica]